MITMSIILPENELASAAASVVALVMGFVGPVIVVLFEQAITRGEKTKAKDVLLNWQRLYETDNPITPWAPTYAE